MITIKPPNLTNYQKKILYSKSRYTITEASTKVGKTYSHMWWLFEQAHLPIYPKGSNFWWVAPVYDQAKIAFNRILEKLKGNYKVNHSELSIHTPIGTVLRFKSADDPNNLYGEDVYAAVFDEFTRAKREAWVALRSTLTFTKGKCKLIGNYKGRNNWGNKLVRDTKNDPEFEYHKITCYDAVNEGILSENEIEQARKDLTDLEFRMLYLCEEIEDEYNIVKFEKINDLWTNNFIKKTGNKFLSCDIALLKDSCIFIVWDGFVITNIIDVPKMPADDLQKKIKEIRELNQIPDSNVIYDGDGIGDAMRSNSNSWIKFNNNANAGVPEYENIKTRCAYVLADMINIGQIFIDCELNQKLKKETIEELQCLRAKETSKKYGIISKDEMKKLIGRSPGILDAIILRMFFKLSRNC